MMSAKEIEEAIKDHAFRGTICASQEEYDEVDKTYYKAIRELRIAVKLVKVIGLIK